MNEIRQVQICSNKHETPLVVALKDFDYSSYLGYKPPITSKGNDVTWTKWTLSETYHFMI